MEEVKEAITIPLSKLFNPKDFDNLGLIIICGICQNILWEPIKCTTCSIGFCKSCIITWVADKKQSCPTGCPLSFEENTSAKEVLQSIMIYCPKGCGSIIPYRQIQEHLTKSCLCVKSNSLSQTIDEQLKELIREVNLMKTGFFRLNNENKKLRIFVNMASTRIVKLEDRIDELENSMRDLNDIPLTTNERAFKSNTHSHLLRKCLRIGFACDNCKENSKDSEMESYCCLECDYDLCLKCQKREVEYNNSYGEMVKPK